MAVIPIISWSIIWKEFPCVFMIMMLRLIVWCTNPILLAINVQPDLWYKIMLVLLEWRIALRCLKMLVLTVTPTILYLPTLTILNA